MTYLHSGGNRPGGLWRALPFALLSLLAGAVFLITHDPGAPRPLAATESAGCPAHTPTGPWPSVKPMNPGIPEHRAGTPRTVRLVVSEESYTRQGFDRGPLTSFPSDPETGETWEADPATDSELTVCAYVMKRGPMLERCQYHWVSVPGGTSPPAEAPPSATVHDTHVLFRVHDTRTGSLRGIFTLHADDGYCPDQPDGHNIAGGLDDAVLRDKAAPYR